MMKKLILLALAVAILIHSSLALAGPRGWGHGMAPGHGSSAYGIANLKLTEEQSAKLQTLREDYLKEVTPLHNRMISLRSELRLLWSDAGPDREKITARQNEISELQRRIDEKATQHRLEMQELLTPEQRSRMIGSGPMGGWDRGPGERMRGGW